IQIIRHTELNFLYLSKLEYEYLRRKKLRSNYSCIFLTLNINIQNYVPKIFIKIIIATPAVQLLYFLIFLLLV
ncbi:hypothetical protein L9F63_020473, partial [Diploptera punctata]